MSDTKPAGYCHTIQPDANQFEECMRLKLVKREVDERSDAVLEEIYCAVCGHVLKAAWRSRFLDFMGWHPMLDRWLDKGGTSD